MKIQTVNQQPLQQRLQTLWVGYFGKTRATGSVIVLVLALLFLITFEMLIMGLVVSRSLGEEGILVSQNLGAREATQVAMTRLVDRLNSYLLTNTAGSAADVAFASGGAQAINNQVLQTRNPEAAGSAEQNTDITISAWVSARRGNYFEISARAVTGGVSLTRKRWVLLNPCNASGTLQTIVSARNHPGAEGAIAVDPISGRVFFGDGNGGSGNFYTWDPATGLSTLVSGRSGLGHQALGIDTSTGRVYFGEAGTGGTRFYTWHSSTGLSVLFTGVKPGLNSVAVDSVNGRVFFGAVNSGDDNFLTWSAATGVSVLLDSIGASAEGCTVTSASSGRVFFCDADILYTWHSSTGLSTVKVGDPLGSDLAMYGTLKIDATDRVYFGETDIGGNHAISRLFTWHSSTGLSTILGGRPDLAGNGNIQIDPTTNRVFFGEYDDDSNPINYYTWHPSTGLSTLVSARPWIGHGSSAISHLDGRVFFGQRATGNFYTWHSTTGLSTLVSNVSNPGAFEAIAVDQTTGRVFWGQDSGTPGNIWTWHASTGLSVLVTGQSDPGDFGNIKAVPGGAYWGTQGAGTARMYYWNSNDGLQTIGFSLTSPGRPRSMNVYQAGQRLYFGEQSATGSFFTFSPGNCQNRGY